MEKVYGIKIGKYVIYI